MADPIDPEHNMTYAPKRGSIIMVNFAMGGKPVGLEMSKETRPCVVVQRFSKMRRGPLVTVVPLSSAEPPVFMPFHHPMDHRSFRQMPESFNRTKPRWAKCDYLTTVSLERCKSPSARLNRWAKRRIIKAEITVTDLEAIDNCIKWALRLD